MTTPYVDPQSVHNPATGTSPPASWGDTVRDGLEFVARSPGVVCRDITDRVIPTATWTSVTFAAADLRDTDSYHDTVTNNTRITIPAGLGGWYNVGGFVRIESATTGVRALRLQVNGSTDYRLFQIGAAPSGASSPEFANQRPLLLNAGDHVELQVFQSSGGNLDIQNGTLAAEFWATLFAV